MNTDLDLVAEYTARQKPYSHIPLVPPPFSWDGSFRAGPNYGEGTLIMCCDNKESPRNVFPCLSNQYINAHSE